MNRITAITVLALSAMLICMSCCKENMPVIDEEKEIPFLEEITFENYPIVDGSTSTAPLNTIIACRLLGIRYEWALPLGGDWSVRPEFSGNLWEKIKVSQTHQSFINLINKDVNLTLSARKMSSDEKAFAEAAGVTLIETPIALDAFIFIVNPKNQIESLTTKQIQDIYTGKITNWNEVGGNNAEINPYVRNANSGSQELMDLLVMKDLEYFMGLPKYEEVVVSSMPGAFEVVGNDVNSLCYTVYYYKEQIVRGEGYVKTITVDGIYPDKETIGNRSYPHVAEVYAIIRADLDKSSMAYKLYEWLQTEEGKDVIRESGYIPNVK